MIPNQWELEHPFWNGHFIAGVMLRIIFDAPVHALVIWVIWKWARKVRS